MLPNLHEPDARAMTASSRDFHGDSDTGLLLVGHGSREPAGRDEFLDVARLAAKLAGPSPLDACFLEFAEPTIAEGFAALARRGPRRIVVVPVLLFAAGHAKRDIPAAVAAATADHSDIVVEQSTHLGCHAAILELSRLRYDEALAPRSHVPGDDTLLVMVGRGSHDDEASAEMRRFVELRRRTTPVRSALTCFVAMAEPSLTAALDEAASCGAKRIVVQPHLLFGGVLLDRIALAVAGYAARLPHLEWVTTGHLGASMLVAEAVLGRAAQTLSLPRA
ncbi:MAG: sirohydrochlorin chelatase [Pirellulales bacterium]